GPDAADRRLDGAPEGDVVRRVDRQAHVRERVLDFFTLVKADAPDDPVGHARAAQRVLEHARLRVRAVEDGDPAPHHPLAAQPEDRLGHEVRLLVLVPGAVDLRRIALGVLGPERLVLALAVVIDDRRGQREDALGRAIVLLELHDPRARRVLLETDAVPAG